MIRSIAAIDDRRGLATDSGIPWRIEADSRYYRSTIAGVDLLMGHGTYAEFSKPYPDCTNYVVARPGSELRDGYTLVDGEVSAFIRSRHEDLWVIGGAGLYETTLPVVDELYLTRVTGDYGCTKFFPAFEDAFRLDTDIPGAPEPGNPPFRFQTWVRH